MQGPIAQWNPKRQLWETGQMDLFSGHSVPYSETLPTSGMTRSGSLLPLPTSAHRTGVNASSSLLLPVASSASLGELARGASAQETGTQPSDGSGDHRREQPAGDSDGHQNTLPGTVRDLLPTPSASDGTGGGQHPDRREGHSRQLCDYALLDGTSRWGKYAAAIARWEAVAGPAPSPTEPNKNGNPRLTAAFPEWMMGWPAGWVTAVPGISRNDALRICGNGVCPQQAYAALQILVRVSACEVAE
ncbi:DNA methyltransferase [Mycobacterium phage Poenanya]|uniref:DNA methylase n=1 Tax=Mycobacterium phage Poenanya TaxID=2500793 RepID=A0A411AX21_9CAUD|nr:DNA methyltransferase [Mycobacterium phage Poenanya]QAX92629.1 DNA methylase [Mycobacterium phage Poenanya]QFP96086.1 hypothetical protein SEA_DOOMPHIST_74 [Mycobacterium phage Doomphist]